MDLNFHQMGLAVLVSRSYMHVTYIPFFMQTFYKNGFYKLQF